MCQSDLNYVEQGKGRFDVALLATVAKDYKKASVRDRGKVERAMRLYARTGRISNLHRYKKQGNFPTGNDGEGKVSVYVFKGYQLRVYGGLVTIRGRQTWVGTAVDPKKKQNKADTGKLEKAAKALGKLAACDK